MKKIDGSIFLTYKEQVQNAIEDLKTKGRRHRQIPNLLTLMRLTAPCFIIPATIMGSVPLVLGLITVFSLTDFADGFIARHWNLTSELGATLDAVTDKVFASTLLLSASLVNPILLCNLGLEFGIAGINIYKTLNSIPVQSSIVGKVKTWFLFGLAGAGILSSSLDIANILNILMVTTTTMQVFTIGSYLFSTSSNQKSNIKVQDTNALFHISHTHSAEQKELQKEKILESDTSVSEIQNESLRQLKAMRQFLISEQNFLESTENKTMDLEQYKKSKKDDFKKS